jgi:poly(A) polymerase/tRNA nucleotidyltransferase (CCA-adding enzyme)
MCDNEHLSIQEHKIPSIVLDISQKLIRNGYQAFLVGGAIRDALLGSQAKDWDVATNATPEMIRDLFSNIKSFYLKHGTVTLVIKGRHLEVTAFRASKGRIGSCLEEDLEHRDFTFNAMAYDIISNKIVDPFGGMQDIKQKVVRAVLSPLERFDEDPLRMMRAIRFSLELGYSIEHETLTVVKTMSQTIDKVAIERVRDEFLRMLVCSKASVGLNLMRRTGILERVLPELMEGYRKRQNSFHKFTIYRHILETVDSIERDPVLRLSALFHDIAKPRVREKSNGRWRFFSHAAASAELTREIMVRLKFSNEWITRVASLVANHMFDYKPDLSDEAIRRFIKRTGSGNVDDLIRLRKADDLAHGWGKGFENQIEEFKNRVYAQIQKSSAFTLSDLAVNGHDIMKVMGLQPGPKVGQILNQLLEAVVERPENNQKDRLIEILEDMKG